MFPVWTVLYPVCTRPSPNVRWNCRALESIRFLGSIRYLRVTIAVPFESGARSSTQGVRPPPRFRGSAVILVRPMKAAPTEPPTPPPVWRRIRRSAFAGFRWSLGLCVIVLVQALVGSASLHGAPALRLLLVFYAAAGTSSER